MAEPNHNLSVSKNRDVSPYIRDAIEGTWGNRWQQRPHIHAEACIDEYVPSPRRDSLCHIDLYLEDRFGWGHRQEQCLIIVLVCLTLADVAIHASFIIGLEVYWYDLVICNCCSSVISLGLSKAGLALFPAKYVSDEINCSGNKFHSGVPKGGIPGYQKHFWPEWNWLLQIDYHPSIPTKNDTLGIEHHEE